MTVRDTFKRWYEERMPELYQFMAYQVGDQMLAEDLVAQTCEKALANLEQYDSSRGAFADWMFGIGRNVVRGYFRRRGPSIVPLDALPPVKMKGASVEEQAEQADQFREVLRRMGALSEQEREVVALRYGAGLSNKEVAKITGLTANHVGVLLHRAVNRLREVMKEAYDA